MSKINIIIQREYSTRVRKKSFLIMTIIGPILMAAMFIIPAYLAQMEDTEKRVIAVIDETNKAEGMVDAGLSGLFYKQLDETPYIQFEYIQGSTVEKFKETFDQEKYFGLLFIPYNVVASNTVEVFSLKQPNIDVVSHIESSVENVIKQSKLRAENINEEILKRVETNITVGTKLWDSEGQEKESSTELAMAIGYIGAFMIYIFVFTYGAQVMRGVIEEKTSRIIEVIVSSVKPFQLMMGKIVGVALVGLTQFALWILLTLAIVSVARLFIPSKTDEVIATQMNPAQDIMQKPGMAQAGEMQVQPGSSPDKLSKLMSFYDPVKVATIIVSFLFFFLGGYLLYSSLFAAIGAAVDNETDTQQFMWPVTIPLILAIVVMISAIKNPDGPIAFWFSMIPFTSPILMMARIPFGVPWWEVFLSAGILIATFIGTTWLAGKIYRTGILMYGKKVDYKELWKWIRYSN